MHGVHPTISGQRLIADYGYSILAAPWEVTLLPEMARSSLNQHQEDLQNHAWSGEPSWQAPRQWRSFAAVSGERSNYHTQKSASDGDSNNYGLSFGGSYRLAEQWRAGVGVSLQENSLTAGAQDSKYHLNSYLFSPFIQYSNQALWGDLTLSARRLDYASLHRKLALNTAARTEKGSTYGSEPGSSVGSLGLGATYKLSDALSVQGNYNYTHADSIRQHGLGVGVSLNW